MFRPVLSVVLVLLILVIAAGCSQKNQTVTPTTVIPATSKSNPVSSTPVASTPLSKPATATLSSIPAGSASSSAAMNSSSRAVTSVPSPVGAVLKLKTVSFVDKEGIGTEAFKLLIPSDWQYEGGVKWVLDNPGMPAVSQFRVWNPQGLEEFRVFPNQPFFWTNNQLTSSLFPVGSKYFGNEVLAPLKPVQALKDIVIARFLPNVQGLKIISEQDISNLVNPPGAAAPSAMQSPAQAGKIRIEYIENGKPIEEEIYCVVESTSFPVQSMYGTTTNTLWGVNYISSFRAEKGKLDANSKLFQTISKSVQLNLKWFNTYVQVIEYLIKMNIQQIKSVGELGSIIAQTGSQIRQENLDLYNQREAVNDRISNQFSQYIRGVDSYYNPLEEKNVELPSGYDNVWVNNLGEYVLAENSSYNPNIGGNQNFQKLELAKK
jgi:hypothetical protein